jgi:hypothetical protein
MLFTKELPGGIDGFTSLEKLYLERCRCLEELPQGLLQRLPALESLTILMCPKLAGRCREGGDYFSFVSSIPCRNIEEPERYQHEERGSNMKKKLIRRLLPSCANSKSAADSG